MIDDRLTFKLELPELALPVDRRPVPRCHYSHQMEDVVFEPEARRRSKPWIDGVDFDPNEEGPSE